ncbi:sigma-54 interaction domain-containing protein [Bacillus sp. FJAT-45350]|uniref:sigma-54 interaction domain-containing protein n=1 Tax=Bacillus sp. FJAT-45350 TaxID=2011014 RepID=UPI00211C6188|nr:sigma 54-interacting transcriptional regulator [Bacillus sp. FJAT-45350]
MLLFNSPHFQATDVDEVVKLFHEIFNTSNDGMYVCDNKGRSILFNKAFLTISGIEERLLYEYSVFELVQKNYAPNSCAAVTLQTKEKHHTIIDYYNGKKGILTSTPIKNENGDIVCVVSNVRDITELNRMQQELEEARNLNYKYKETLYQIQGEINREKSIVYCSKSMQKIVSLAFRLSKNDSPVLILGESGVGKDVLARYIHKESGRSGPFVTINCGAIPDHLLESELFGYEKGAFTGANQSKVGLFELAHKGTIFLDEIGDLPFALQVKLLTVLQDQKFRRVGGTQSIEVDMRIVAATNNDLEKLIAEKKFREDLYYRLNVLQLGVPPLRERPDDVPALAFHFLKELNEKYIGDKKLQSDTIECLSKYPWPGNIRELKNILERTYHLSETDKIGAETLPEKVRVYNRDLEWNKVDVVVEAKEVASKIEDIPLKEAIHLYEREYIKQKLIESRTLNECAQKLKIDISTLIRKRNKLGIQK